MDGNIKAPVIHTLFRHSATKIRIIFSSTSTSGINRILGWIESDFVTQEFRGSQGES